MQCFGIFLLHQVWALIFKEIGVVDKLSAKIRLQLLVAMPKMGTWSEERRQGDMTRGFKKQRRLDSSEAKMPD